MTARLANGTLSVIGNGGTRCYGDLTGFLAGAGASYAGLLFVFTNQPVGGLAVNGVIAFATRSH